MVHPRRVEEGFGHTPLDIEMYHDLDSYHHKNEEARIDDVNHGMDNEKEQTIITQDDQTVEEGKKDEQPPPGTIIKPKSKRVATLDAFRGLTIVVMILVDDAGEAYPRIEHSPLNGCTLADFVLPFFLFIVGVAISFALKKVPVVKDAVKKIIIRTLKLLFWGIILQGIENN
ncbi:Heparan-alpha-glucosaminide N-acetyltransferase [Camellia lanceoleosa]|uniref:Heparan-alpha-glucosaminide N-acetyltransferase n=1 Tax=Camellia lanceoleosa TaxID=1840588 RepID=A0ACC0HU41_9ERIC|nr:Heparan-alpha-glucosaminide N-acetyltransferase [Camellia lanceoleosa]